MTLVELQTKSIFYISIFKNLQHFFNENLIYMFFLLHLQKYK